MGERVVQISAALSLRELNGDQVALEPRKRKTPSASRGERASESLWNFMFGAIVALRFGILYKRE